VARTLTASDLCSETGASADQLEWLTSIGILHPLAPGLYKVGDVFRVKMIRSLLDAGFSGEQVEAAVSSAGLNLEHVDRYVFREPGERSPRTLAEFAAELGPEAERLIPAVYQLLGLTPPDPASHLALDEEALVREFLEAWTDGENDDTQLRAARLVGEGTRMAVAGWGDLLYERVAGPARERWLRREVEEYPREVADTVARAFALMPRLVHWLMQRYVEQSVTSGIANNFEEVLASRGLAPPPDPPNPPAVVFVDVSGYTSVTEQHGDKVAVSIAAALQRRADGMAAAHGGRVVKLLGDGAMLLFPDARAAVEAAAQLVRALDSDLDLSAHAGVHAGRVIERDRDLFGSTVNLAFRVTAAAGPGEVLVTEVVARQAKLPEDRIESIGSVPLKGVSQPVPLLRVLGT
jgi:adenylate cyclase